MFLFRSLLQKGSFRHTLPVIASERQRARQLIICHSEGQNPVESTAVSFFSATGKAVFPAVDAYVAEWFLPALRQLPGFGSSA